MTTERKDDLTQDGHDTLQNLSQLVTMKLFSQKRQSWFFCICNYSKQLLLTKACLGQCMKGTLSRALGDFPGNLGGKAFHLQCGRSGFEPWLRKISWRREWQPTLLFLPNPTPSKKGTQRHILNLRQKPRTSLSVCIYVCLRVSFLFFHNIAEVVSSYRNCQKKRKPLQIKQL